MSENSKCPKCGAPLPADSPEGLCPRCLVAMNLATQTEIPGETGPQGIKIVKPPLPVDEVAKLFPQLEILECLGRGGMGAVYKARQPRLDRIVALKILSPEKQGEPKFAERFEREARALAKLHHPNIVTVYDFGEVGQASSLSEKLEAGKMPAPLFYLLMEFVDGLTLRQLLQAQKISPQEALAIVPKICEALQYAHEQGIVHRDIKPENILLDKSGQLKIADFGIAKILGDGGRANLTAEQVVGTPHYMSPEQIEKPQSVDHRADIYSLGVVFYEMLTGELPLGKFSPPSKKVQIDVRLDEIVLRALEKEPERRYQKASDVKTQVETIAATPESCSSRGDEAQTENRSHLTTAKNEPRFSRTSIAGVCWLAIFVLVALPAPAFFRVSALTFGLFGTMILGWIAVSQIRRSSGKLYGMWLAVFNGLFFPLLALDALIAGFWMFMLRVVFLNHLMIPICALLALITIICIDFIIIRFVWRAANQLVAASAPPVQKPDRFWRWFAVTVLALISIPFLISIFGILAAIAIPNFIKGRQHALALREQQIAATNFFIGQTWFSQGNSIEITSVERNANQMTVKGRYNLASQDSAMLALYVTTESSRSRGDEAQMRKMGNNQRLLTSSPTNDQNEMKISKGNGDFELTDSHLLPGLPHVSMYADGKPFASVYFGNKQEAAEERAAGWITNAPVSATAPRSISANLSATNILAMAKHAYASLSAYRDTGWIVHKYKSDAWTNKFTESFEGRNHYRIEIVTAAHPFSYTNEFWSDGLDNYFQMQTPTVFKSSDLDGNLSPAADDTAIPAVFFNLSWGNVFIPFGLGPQNELVRQADEKIGDTDCYVVSRVSVGNHVALYVGKKDFLIRRYLHSTGDIELHENIVTEEKPEE